MTLSAALNNNKRTVRDITAEKDMQANLMDRKNLHVIRLFGESYPEDTLDELDAEDISDQAVAMLMRVTEIIKRNGIILIEDFEESFFSHKDFRKAFRGLFNNQKQIYIFNYKQMDRYLSALEKQGIVVLIEKSINDFFEGLFTETVEDDIQISERSAQIYIEAEKSLTPTAFES